MLTQPEPHPSLTQMTHITPLASCQHAPDHQGPMRKQPSPPWGEYSHIPVPGLREGLTPLVPIPLLLTMDLPDLGKFSSRQDTEPQWIPEPKPGQPARGSVPPVRDTPSATGLHLRSQTRPPACSCPDRFLGMAVDRTESQIHILPTPTAPRKPRKQGPGGWSWDGHQGGI